MTSTAKHTCYSAQGPPIIFYYILLYIECIIARKRFIVSSTLFSIDSYNFYYLPLPFLFHPLYFIHSHTHLLTLSNYHLRLLKSLRLRAFLPQVFWFYCSPGLGLRGRKSRDSFYHRRRQRSICSRSDSNSANPISLFR